MPKNILPNCCLPNNILPKSCLPKNILPVNSTVLKGLIWEPQKSKPQMVVYSLKDILEFRYYLLKVLDKVVFEILTRHCWFIFNEKEVSSVSS